MTRAPCEAEELRREIAKRVERSYDQSPNAYARRARRGGGGNAQ